MYNDVNHGETMVLERVQKIISNSGYCSRRQAEHLISIGLVKVNDKLIKLGDKADYNIDKIEIEGNVLKTSAKKIYLMLNKPKHYVTTTKDPFCKNTVMKLIYEDERVYPVGRLDALTTGLLLFTNDGEFANKVMHPRYEVKKTYMVKLDRPLSSFDKKEIEKGVELDDFTTGASKIEILDKETPDECSITINEGKNKEVKRVFKSFGYHVDELHRISVGGLKLDVPEGRYRYLTKDDISRIFGTGSDTKDQKEVRKANRK